ncbi:MAG: hypothetical protein R6U96_10110, partial [Promethearchaeia archaeon]
MTYGGKTQWIDAAQRKNPETSWFIFIIGADPKPDHWEPLKSKIEELKKKQEDFPDTEKIKYSIVEPNLENNLVKLIRHFRALISHVSSQEYRISANLTAGIFEQRIALYLASEIESGKI